MGGERILLIEDDPGVALFIARALELAAYYVTIAPTGAAGVQIARDARPDLILLDLMLPDMHGIDLCREVRQDAQVAATPLVVVTGSAQVGLRIAALEAGADDYLTKPLIVDELCARVRAQLRKASPQTGASLQLDPATNSVMVDGQARRLTLREFQLLAYLVRHAGQVCAQDQLLQDVWGYPPEYVDPGLVRWQIRKLRERIEPDPKRPRYIHMVKQRGYMFRDDAGGRAIG